MPSDQQTSTNQLCCILWTPRTFPHPFHVIILVSIPSSLSLHQSFFLLLCLVIYLFWNCLRNYLTLTINFVIHCLLYLFHFYLIKSIFIHHHFSVRMFAYIGVSVIFIIGLWFDSFELCSFFSLSSFTHCVCACRTSAKNIRIITHVQRKSLVFPSDRWKKIINRIVQQFDHPKNYLLIFDSQKKEEEKATTGKRLKVRTVKSEEKRKKAVSFWAFFLYPPHKNYSIIAILAVHISNRLL